MRAQLQEQMYALILKFESSGQTRRSFCESHGIKLPKFQYWHTKYQQSQQAKVGFAKLEISSPSGLAPKILTIKMTNGTIIEIPV